MSATVRQDNSTNSSCLSSILPTGSKKVNRLRIALGGTILAYVIKWVPRIFYFGPQTALSIFTNRLLIQIQNQQHLRCRIQNRKNLTSTRKRFSHGISAGSVFLKCEMDPSSPVWHSQGVSCRAEHEHVSDAHLKQSCCKYLQHYLLNFFLITEQL